MAERHQPTDDVVYNLVSVQYHALNGSQLYDKFVTDAEGHEDVQNFFRPRQPVLRADRKTDWFNKRLIAVRRLAQAI